jgi:hypothetical protein
MMINTSILYLRHSGHSLKGELVKLTGHAIYILLVDGLRSLSIIIDTRLTLGLVDSPERPEHSKQNLLHRHVL